MLFFFIEAIWDDQASIHHVESEANMEGNKEEESDTGGPQLETQWI